MPPAVAVAAAHMDSYEQDVASPGRVDIKFRHAIFVTVYTNTTPSGDTEVVVKSCIGTELSHSDCASVYEHACDGSVDVQVASPSSEHVSFLVGLVYVSLSPVTVAVRDPLDVNSISSP